MPSFTTLPNPFWRTMRSLLTGLAFPVILSLGLTHSALPDHLTGSLVKAGKDLLKEPSTYQKQSLPPTSATFTAFTGIQPRILEPTQPARVPDPLLSYWNGFSMQDLSLASWVTVDGGFSLPILQQPLGESMYVSGRPNTITQFSRPALNGVTALLAHNYRSGMEFYTLSLGQKISITYSEAITREYEVVSISSFQKLVPSDNYSDLIDLETNTRLSSTQVYNRFYSGTPHVTFQTCLEKDGNWEWGLYFVVAVPAAR